MSQHDLNIANQGFPAFRADLNDALLALGSTNSGATAPATTFANQLWYDTANNILKIRNEDNDAWISIATLDQTADTVSAITAATLNANTVNTAALNTTGNTVLGDASTDTLNVGNGGLVKDAAGNIGIGVTPSVSTLSGFIEGFYGNIGFTSGLGVSIAGNAYYNSNWKYKLASTATLQSQDSGGFKWFTAPTGTIGNAITFTQSLGIVHESTLTLAGGTSSIGTGIAFPATQSASSNANTLDDYEEGTWTPLLQSTGGSPTVTYVNQIGRYTKIGRIVTVQGRLQISAISGGAGNIIISGLPFANGIGITGAGASWFSGLNYGAGTWANTYFTGNDNHVCIASSSSGTGAGATQLLIGAVGSIFDTAFQFTYTTS